MILGDNLCVIPARGGSKRIPRKNIRNFCGQPMIAWSIAAAQNSGIFDHVIVSTDDEEIAEIAIAHGASVPFMRPAALADDYTGITSVIRHAITWLRDVGKEFNLVTCVYATAPFIQSHDLVESSAILQRQPDADFVLAVTSFASPVQRAIAPSSKGWLKFLWPEFGHTRSQDTQESYHDAGHFFMGRSDAFMRYATTLSGQTLPYLIPRILSQDIDTHEDWQHATELFTYLQSKKSSVI